MKASTPDKIDLVLLLMAAPANRRGMLALPDQLASRKHVPRKRRYSKRV